ncbi:uncharacterized protein TEOVI_000609700 [Trypanosoma equiperdum]|uniref:COP9 signalosome complex subunit 7 n=2 Tax=Trypanozoon TaxID=39700 RepID=Q387K8_TRYB2|nr:hypothetical protein, conserved [Trypanosoma brucei brucei TREU927]EAN79023.1 hypothetical protein, conserved [Trypanosoma brucei brucei TREU927]SCU67749.1 hypothetical protein, conserved [Trypanosoma equiperdum]
MTQGISEALARRSIEEYAHLVAASTNDSDRVCLIMEAVEAPHIFFYGVLLHIPSVMALATNPSFAWVPQLLEVLCYGNTAELCALPADVQKRLPSSIYEKMRKLSVLSLCRGDVISLKNIREIVGGSGDVEVEVLLLEMMSEGLIEGCIDQRQDLFLLKDWAPRDVRPSEIGKMREKLEAWCANCDAQITAIQRILKGEGEWQ